MRFLKYKGLSNQLFFIYKCLLISGHSPQLPSRCSAPQPTLSKSTTLLQSLTQVLSYSEFDKFCILCCNTFHLLEPCTWPSFFYQSFRDPLSSNSGKPSLKCLLRPVPLLKCTCVDMWKPQALQHHFRLHAWATQGTFPLTHWYTHRKPFLWILLIAEYTWVIPEANCSRRN